jgi:hypothetical protein
MQKKHNLTVRFSTEELEKLREIAKKESRPVANLINIIVVRYMDSTSKDQKRGVGMAKGALASAPRENTQTRRL